MATYSEVAQAYWAPLSRRLAQPWIAGWALAVAILIVIFGADALEQTFREPDSAMRLVQVRDLLGGQGWFDTTQYRLKPPDGVAMHWSRWVDAAIAGGIGGLTPVVGRDAAEVAVAFAWPLGLLAAFMFIVTRIAGVLASASAHESQVRWTAALVAALAFPAIDRFAPGMFDHHNVVLVLVVGAVWALMTMSSDNRRGLLAGGALALAVVTAAEALPFLATGSVVAGLLWIVRPARFAASLFQFGAGMSVVMLAGFLTHVPPSAWSQAQCDAISTSFLSIGLASGFIAICLSRVSHQRLTGTVSRRLMCALAGGGVAALALLVLAPACLGGGYGDVSPEMRTLWMEQIGEARPLTQLWSDNIAHFFALAGAALAACFLAVVQLRDRSGNHALWIAAAFLLCGVVLMVWQVRGASFATAFAVPFAASAIVDAHSAYRKAPGLRALGVICVLVLAGSAAGWSAVGNQLQRLTTSSTVMVDFAGRQADSSMCFERDLLAQLNRAYPGVILNQFVIGSGVLAASHHSVLAAPYHRNAAGTLAAMEAFRSDDAAAREILAQTGADYVLICDGLPEASFYIEHAAEGVGPENTLAARLGSGAVPGWLEPVEGIDSPLALYRVQSLPVLRGRH